MIVALSIVITLNSNSASLTLESRRLQVYNVFVKVYPMAVVGTAARGVIIYQLENQPQEFKRMESPLKYQVIEVMHL